MAVTDWKLWGNASKPILIGSEQDVKGAYTEATIDDVSTDTEYYIEDPDGDEWMWDGHNWVEAT